MILTKAYFDKLKKDGKWEQFIRDLESWGEDADALYEHFTTDKPYSGSYRFIDIHIGDEHIFKGYNLGCNEVNDDDCYHCKMSTYCPEAYM